MFRLVRYLPMLAAVLAAALSGTQAQAGLLPNLKPIAQIDNTWKFNYDVDIGAKSQVNPGDFFTIYDFAGFVSGSNTQPAGWVFSSALGGTNPTQTSPNDDATTPNLTWTYMGNSPILGPKTNLSDFTALSLFMDTREDDFGSSIHRTDTGKIENNITPVDVPVDLNPGGGGVDPPDPPAAPEPTTIALLGLSLPLLGALKLLRRRRKAS